MKPFISNPSIATLEDTAPRALEFLRGAGASPEILRLLSNAGYTKKAHEEGLQLLTTVVSYVREKGAFQSVSPAYERAVAEVTTWQKKDLRRIKATLTRLHPNEAEYLFSNLDFAPGVDAVLMVSMFLDRLASLANDPARKATRKADHAVLQTIKERGVSEAELTHLRAAVREAVAMPLPEVTPPNETEARIDALRALRAWYTDWAETARAVLTRRDHLIRVGLATRKRAQPPMPVIATTGAPPPAPDAMRALPMTASTGAA